VSFWIGLSRQQLQRALSLRYDLPRLQRDRQINDHVRRHGVNVIAMGVSGRTDGNCDGGVGGSTSLQSFPQKPPRGRAHGDANF